MRTRMQSTATEPLQTCPVIGTPLAITDYTKAVAHVRAWAGERTATRVVAAANTHVVTLARHDRSFGAALEKFDLVLPDGMPLVWVMNRACNAGLSDRVYGPTFMLHCLEATQNEFSHFFLGGSPELLEVLQQKLREKYPNLRIAGVYSPPFGEWPDDEDARIIEKIAVSRADFVWIGLGCPKQEIWIARNKSHLPVAIYAGVGAAFAFHAGLVRQAPLWIQSAGLEWLFRMLTEPRRLWRRYVKFNSLFLFYLLLDKLRGRQIRPRN